MRYPLCGSTQETAGCCHCHWDCCQYSCCCSCCSCCCCISRLAWCSSIFAAMCFCCLPWILWNLALPMAASLCCSASSLLLGGFLLPHFGQPLSLHIASWGSAAAWCSFFFWQPPIFFLGLAVLRPCMLVPVFPGPVCPVIRPLTLPWPQAFFFPAIALSTLAAPSSGSASLPKSIFPGYFCNLLVAFLLATLWVLAGCCHFYFFQVGMAYPSLGKMMGIASSLPLPFSRLSSCALFKALKCALVRVWIYALCKACQRAFSNWCPKKRKR